jgi:hypothetical protein
LTGSDTTVTNFSIVTAPDGCTLLLITCPLGTRFNVLYANGAIVSDVYSSPIVLNCSNAVSSTTVFSFNNADQIARLRLFGIEFNDAPQMNIWIGAITGLQVTGCFCSAASKYIIQLHLISNL